MFSADDDIRVRLAIHGPNSIVGPKPIPVKANVNTSWISLLNDKLKLQVGHFKNIWF